jgi:hypothetical protein
VQSRPLPKLLCVCFFVHRNHENVSERRFYELAKNILILVGPHCPYFFY